MTIWDPFSIPLFTVRHCPLWLMRLERGVWCKLSQSDSFPELFLSGARGKEPFLLLSRTFFPTHFHKIVLTQPCYDATLALNRVVESGWKLDPRRTNQSCGCLNEYPQIFWYPLLQKLEPILPLLECGLDLVPCCHWVECWCVTSETGHKKDSVCLMFSVLDHSL